MSAEPVPAATISDRELLDRLARVIAASLRIDPSRVAPEATLLELGAESIDVVEITLDVEHAFTVLMPEHTILQLGADVAGADVFERDGALTELGAALLRARLPDENPASLAPGVPVRELAPAFLRVRTWIGLIRGLLEASPRTCPQCRGPLVQGPPAQVRCPACNLVLDLPAGDELGREWVRRWLAARTA